MDDRDKENGGDKIGDVLDGLAPVGDAVSPKAGWWIRLGSAIARFGASLSRGLRRG